MEYELSDLIDICQLQKLQNSFYTATGIASGIVSRDGTILTATAWRDICTKFHRVNPKSALRCIESDIYIGEQIAKGDQLVNFKCKNGLMDIGTPIIVEGNYLATLFVGQIFFEEPNIEYFRKQAKDLDFDEEAYLNALKEIPIVNADQYEKILKFLADLAQLISEMGLTQLRLIETQKSLKLSDERYKLALYGSNDGIWDWHFINRDFYASYRFTEILGYTQKEITGLFSFWKKLIHPDDVHSCMLELRYHLKNKTSNFNHEARLKTVTGTYKWVLIRGSAIWNEQGVPIRMAGSLTDLSNKKSSEERLKIEQNFSKSIMDHANIIICIWNKDGTLVQFNKYGQAHTGYSEEEVLYYNWMNTLWPGDLSERTLDFIHSFNADLTTNQVEGPLFCKNGSELTVLWSNQLLKNEDGSIKNIVGMGLDITQRKNEEKRLTEFFANISHELRTPLNIIFSSLQLIEFYIDNNLLYNNINKIKKHKNSMKQNCFRLIRLVNNLIDITKIDAGYLELNIENCDIVSLVEDITLSVAGYIENRGLTLQFDTDIEEKTMQCDPDKIERIILNLLSNAIKFTKPGGSLLVNLQDKGQSICISVKDTGIGIDESKFEIIFERFKQINKSLTREHEGSGIGLSLVKSLVEMHNGTVEVKSECGKGSEFIIEFPISQFNFKEISTSLKELCSVPHDQIEKINIEFSDIYSS